MQILTKWVSRKLALSGGTILALLEAEQYEAAAAVAVGYALAQGLMEAAEALGASKYLGHVVQGLTEGVEAGKVEEA
jgi:hypothetical protein